jgi:hypothetical protein
LRLLRHMSVREAIRHTLRVSGHRLYANPSDWSRAKGKAAKHSLVESVEWLLSISLKQTSPQEIGHEQTR